MPGPGAAFPDYREIRSTLRRIGWQPHIQSMDHTRRLWFFDRGTSAPYVSIEMPDGVVTSTNARWLDSHGVVVSASASDVTAPVGLSSAITAPVGLSSAINAFVGVERWFRPASLLADRDVLRTSIADDWSAWNRPTPEHPKTIACDSKEAVALATGSLPVSIYLDELVRRGRVIVRSTKRTHVTLLVVVFLRGPWSDDRMRLRRMGFVSLTREVFVAAPGLSAAEALPL